MTEKPEGYLWDHTLDDERSRLEAQAAIWDPHTMRYLELLDVRPGWRCLEVGAGTGTITRWLTDRVSPGGSVVATDLDTRFLAALDHPAVEIRAHDITADDLEESAFDLVYARMVLMHLPEADTHLEKMLRAVAPGGWLLVQDVDLAYLESPGSKHFTWPQSNQRFSTKIMRALNGLLTMTGADPAYARSHATRLLSLGLEDVRAEAVNHFERGRPDSPYRAAFERVMQYLVQFSGITERQAQRRLDQVSNPSYGFSSGPMISAWGRRPR